MNALVLSAVVLFILVGAIVLVAGEFGKGGDAAKSTVLLAGLSLVSGYIVALASGSL